MSDGIGMARGWPELSLPRSSIDICRTVAICTRNRAQQVGLALSSVLKFGDADLEVIIVDQSDADDTETFVTQLQEDDPRVRYVRDRRIGLSRARNLALRLASSNVVAFTDDDCEVAMDWLGRLVAPFTDPQMGLAFGSVVPADCDEAKGFIIGFRPAIEEILAGRISKMRARGIGASMAIRRSHAEAVGAFDEMLGPGGYFENCDDQDMTYRMLAAGYRVAHVPKACVIHHGLRTWQEGSRYTYVTFISIAAAYMKYVRRCDGVAALVLAHELLLALFHTPARLARWRSPFGIRRLVGLLVGIHRSFELDLDPKYALYRLRASRQPNGSRGQTR